MRQLWVACVGLYLLLPSVVQARAIAGVNFPDASSAVGSAGSLVGVGVRTTWMGNVYAMGVCQATIKKSAAHITGSDEPKLLWLHVLRGISGDKMKDAIDDGLEKNTSEADRAKMQPDIDRLKAAFPANIPKGLVIQFVYTPAKGATLKLGGSEKVAVPGKAFMQSIWKIWFGSSPADKGLRDSVLG